MELPFVSVVVPIYNEEARIRTSLSRMLGYLRSRFRHFEIVLVDDGSTDDTQHEIVAVAERDQRVRVLSFNQNHGKGFAVRHGMLKAEGDVIIFTDADLSTPIEEVEKVIRELSSGYPVVAGSRQHPGSVICVRQSWLRETMGKTFNWLVRSLLGLPFRDTQCGFKGFSREPAKEIFSRTRIDGFAFDVEVLLVAQRLGYPVKDIPISWTNSPASKVKILHDSLYMLKELFTIYSNVRRGLYGRGAAHQ